MELNFTKCHGSGNDFILLDARAIDLDDSSWGRVARVLSDRAGPVGAALERLVEQMVDQKAVMELHLQ